MAPCFPHASLRTLPCRAPLLCAHRICPPLCQLLQTALRPVRAPLSARAPHPCTRAPQVGSGVHNCLEWELLWLLPLKRLAKDIFHGRAAPRDWAPILPTIYRPVS